MAKMSPWLVCWTDPDGNRRGRECPTQDAAEKVAANLRRLHLRGRNVKVYPPTQEYSIVGLERAVRAALDG